MGAATENGHDDWQCTKSRPDAAPISSTASHTTLFRGKLLPTHIEHVRNRHQALYPSPRLQSESDLPAQRVSISRFAEHHSTPRANLRQRVY